MKLSEALNIVHELLEELQEDLSDGVISSEEILGVVVEGNVIVDYYYNEEVERKNLLHEPMDYESDYEVRVRKDAWLQYKKDKPNLVYVTVRQLIFKLNAFISYYSPK